MGSTAHEAFGPYLRTLRRRWRFVLVVTLLTAGVAAFTLLRGGPTYQATASVLVSPLPQGDPNFIGIGVVLDTGDPARTVQTAAALINSLDAARATAATLGHGWTANGVGGQVSVTPLGQSDVIAVTAKSSSAEGAAHLANTFATAAVANRGKVVQRNINAELGVLQSRIAALPTGTPGNSAEVQDLSARIGELRAAKSNGGDPTLAVSQPATVPSSPTGAPHWLIILLSLIGGFAIASVAALALEFFSRPVRDEDELESLFPAPVLASIPNVRHGRGERLSPWQFPPAAFEQVRMLRVQLELTTKPSVIMVTSAGAGDGKTTLVAALAAAYAESGQNIVLMDLDFRKPSLAKVLEIPEAIAGDGAPHKPQGALVEVPKLPNVKLLPLPSVNAAMLDTVMLRLPLLLAQAQRVASCVILDTAPIGEVSEALRIAPLCESLLFVTRPRHTDRRRLVLARDLLSRAGAPQPGLVLVGQALTNAYGGYYGYAYTGTNGAFAGAPQVDPPVRVARADAEQRDR